MPEVQVQASRETLRGEYLELVRLNPILAKIEGACLAMRWSEEEIRTMQLLAAVKSNQSLQTRLAELEQLLARRA